MFPRYCHKVDKGNKKRKKNSEKKIVRKKNRIVRNNKNSIKLQIQIQTKITLGDQNGRKDTTENE